MAIIALLGLSQVVLHLMLTWLHSSINHGFTPTGTMLAAHVAVLVHYPETLPTSDVDALREYVADPKGNRVVGGAEPGQSAKLKAVNAFEVMTCDTVDLKALDAFKKAWFDDSRSRPVE